MSRATHTQIVGLGSAAVGLFITADRIGVLEAFMERGIVVHERAQSAQDWTSLAYHVKSNSPISDFLFGIRPDGLFSAEFCASRAPTWIKDDVASIDLIEMSRFFKRLMLRIVHRIERSDTCEIRWGHSVQNIHMTTDDRFLVPASDGADPVLSQSLVLATGASNRIIGEAFARIGDVVSCDQVLRGHRNALLTDALRNGRHIIVLGGSHSGFSGLGYIFERFGNALLQGQLHIVSRGKVLEMFDKSEAHTHTLSRRDKINPMTGEINRFTGLRRDSRLIFRALRSGAETRAILHELSDHYDAKDLLDLCGLPAEIRPLLINATGYRPRLPTLFDRQGQELQIDLSHGNARKCSMSGELYCCNRKVTKLFGTGLGYADQGPDGPQVGMNFFNSSTSQRIVENILS